MLNVHGRRGPSASAPSAEAPVASCANKLRRSVGLCQFEFCHVDQSATSSSAAHPTESAGASAAVCEGDDCEHSGTTYCRGATCEGGKTQVGEHAHARLRGASARYGRGPPSWAPARRHAKEGRKGCCHRRCHQKRRGQGANIGKGAARDRSKPRGAKSNHPRASTHSAEHVVLGE